MYPEAIINSITINSFVIINVLISSDKALIEKFHTEETCYCSCWSF